MDTYIQYPCMYSITHDMSNFLAVPKQRSWCSHARRKLSGARNTGNYLFLRQPIGLSSPVLSAWTGSSSPGFRARFSPSPAWRSLVFHGGFPCRYLTKPDPAEHLKSGMTSCVENGLGVLGKGSREYGGRSNTTS